MKVLANDGISESGEKALKEAGINLLDNRVSSGHLAQFINDNEVDVLLVRSATKVTKELIDACPTLRIVGRGGIGMDNIDVEYAREKDIYVFNTPLALYVLLPNLFLLISFLWPETCTSRTD